MISIIDDIDAMKIEDLLNITDDFYHKSMIGSYSFKYGQNKNNEDLIESLIFQHHSPNFFEKLKPVSYSKNENSRTKEYWQERIVEEKQYHNLLTTYNKNNSFLYATIVGYNKMESAKSYPGYTYYFKLSKNQIEKTIFRVSDKELSTKPSVGKDGLIKAIDFWKENKKEFKSYQDDIVEGKIDPRIEVVISFPVDYFDFVSQIEDR